MIDASMIPDEVVEELHSRFAWIGNADGAREAIAAVLNSWPGVWTSESVGNGSLILPLPKEPRA